MSHHFYGDLSNLNAPYDGYYPLQGVGGVTWEGKTLPAIGYPWREASDDTLNFQASANVALAKRDFCPLLLDGHAGPRTCGAIFTLDELSAPDGLVATCAQHAGEAMAPSSCPGGIPPVNSPPPSDDDGLVVEPKEGGIPVWVWGLGVGILVVGLALASKKKGK